MNLEKLEIQLDFLRDDLLNFEINPHYAVRIATLIRIMVHDTTKPNGEPGSISLLTHLNLKQKFLFLNSCEALGQMPVDNFSDKNAPFNILGHDTAAQFNAACILGSLNLGLTISFSI